MICDETTAGDSWEVRPAERFHRQAGHAESMVLKRLWEREGLPGTIAFAHVAGEVEIMLDHETIRWARSLMAGDGVELEDLASRPPGSRVGDLAGRVDRLGFMAAGSGIVSEWMEPHDWAELSSLVRIKAVVKDVKPWRRAHPCDARDQRPRHCPIRIRQADVP